MNIPPKIQRVASIAPVVVLCLGLIGGLYQARSAGRWMDSHLKMVSFSQRVHVEGESGWGAMEEAKAQGGDWAIAAELAGLREALWIGFSVACALGLAADLRSRATTTPPADPPTSGT